jgi:pyruvate/2-oxoglutarate dehydrogenase complex dihydrolipoamide dehydrogenase (E3) component
MSHPYSPYNHFEATWNSRLDMFGIFTDPEIVQVGQTLDQAREAGIDAVSAEYRLR